MENIMFAAAIVVLTLAAVCFIKAITNYLLSVKKEPLYALTLLPVNENSQDIEFTVRNILWSKGWDRISDQEVLLVLGECSDETKAICYKLSEEYAAVDVCTCSELQSVMRLKLNHAF